MANSKGIAYHELYKKQADAFLKAKRSLKNTKGKSIHQLRISIKSLRVHLQFIERVLKTDGHSQKLLRALKPVFKAAGNIRTASLNLKLVGEAKECASYIKHLKKSKDKALQSLNKSIEKFGTSGLKKHNKKIKELLDPLKRKIILDECRLLINEKENHIKEELKHKIKAETLHEIRKDLKIIKAIKKIISEISGRKNLLKRIDELTELEETIGKWHDRAILLDDLLLFTARRKNNPFLSAFIGKLHKETDVSQKHSVELLKKYFI